MDGHTVGHVHLRWQVVDFMLTLQCCERMFIDGEVAISANMVKY